LLVVPALVTTEDASTADRIELTGPAPAASGEPQWSVEIPGVHPAYAPTIHTTPGGLVVDEAEGVRVIDPRNGQEGWHWR
jgi:hypothetical protein